MATTKSGTDIRIKQYETTVIEFLHKEGGHFIVASHDNMFLSVLRSTISKQLAITDDCITSIQDENRIIKSIKDVGMRRKRIVLFIERVLNGKETGFLIKQIKEAYTNTKIIILTGEADRQRLVLLHEIGADNFISKPISINTLIEKIAFTIKPQGKIGKLIDAAKLLVSQNSFEQALKAARQILEVKPNSAAGYLVMGDAYKGLGKKDKAVESYLAASNNAKLYLEPLKKLAEFFEEEGDVEQQLLYLEKLDRLSPLNVERKVDMGGIHITIGNEDKAEELFDNAMKQAKKEAMNFIEEVSTKIGNLYSNINPERAAKYYRQALEAKGDMLTSDDIVTFNFLGIALRKQGKWKEALEEYKKALEIVPEDEHLFYNMAMAYAEGGEYRLAQRHLLMAIEIDNKFGSKDPVLSYNIGLILAKAGSVSKAKAYLQNSLRLKPDFSSPKKLLANLK